MFMIVEVMLWLCIRCKRIFEGVLMFTYSSHKSEFGGLFGFSTQLTCMYMHHLATVHGNLK